MLTVVVVRSRNRTHPAAAVLVVPVAASVRSVAAGTARSIRPAGTGPGVAESASSFADGSRAAGRRDRVLVGVHPDLGDLQERRLAGRLRDLPAVADVGLMVEKRRTIAGVLRLGDRPGVADSCLGVDAGRRWPEGKCMLVVEEEPPGHRPRHIQSKLLAECGPHSRVERSRPDWEMKFDREPGWIGWCKSERR